MSFFHKKNVTKCLGHHYAIWTNDSNFLLAPKKKFRASQRLVLISGTVHVLNRVFHHQKYFPNEIQWHLLIKQAKKKGRRKKKK